MSAVCNPEQLPNPGYEKPLFALATIVVALVLGYCAYVAYQLRKQTLEEAKSSSTDAQKAKEKLTDPLAGWTTQDSQGAITVIESLMEKVCDCVVYTDTAEAMNVIHGSPGLDSFFGSQITGQPLLCRTNSYEDGWRLVTCIRDMIKQGEGRLAPYMPADQDLLQVSFQHTSGAILGTNVLPVWLPAMPAADGHEGRKACICLGFRHAGGPSRQEPFATLSSLETMPKPGMPARQPEANAGPVASTPTPAPSEQRSLAGEPEAEAQCELIDMPDDQPKQEVEEEPEKPEKPKMPEEPAQESVAPAAPMQLRAGMMMDSAAVERAFDAESGVSAPSNASRSAYSWTGPTPPGLPEPETLIPPPEALQAAFESQSRPQSRTQSRAPSATGLNEDPDNTIKASAIPAPDFCPPVEGNDNEDAAESEISDSSLVNLSKGSVGHPHNCQPACKFVKSKNGCKDGAACIRCHACCWKKTKATRPDKKRDQTSTIATGASQEMALPVGPLPPGTSSKLRAAAQQGPGGSAEAAEAESADVKREPMNASDPQRPPGAWSPPREGEVPQTTNLSKAAEQKYFTLADKEHVLVQNTFLRFQEDACSSHMESVANVQPRLCHSEPCFPLDNP